MDDSERFQKINKHICSVESFFDVLHVILKHSLLGEIKSSSMSYLFSDMEESLEVVKKLNKETYEKIEELKSTMGKVE